MYSLNVKFLSVCMWLICRCSSDHVFRQSSQLCLL